MLGVTSLIHRKAILAILLAVLYGCEQNAVGDEIKSENPNYPPTRTVDQRDDYHGASVADPYRWMEDQDDQEVRDWVTAQNNLTDKWLSDRVPLDRIEEKLRELAPEDTSYSMEYSFGRYVFYYRHRAGEPRGKLYVRDAEASAVEVLIDPIEVEPDGSWGLLSAFHNPDGEYTAYGLNEAGSDWQVVRIRETRSKKDLPEKLYWLKESFISDPIAWRPEGDGFYYLRFPAPEGDENALQAANKVQSIYYHELGQSQEEDRLVYAQPMGEGQAPMGMRLGENGRYLYILLERAYGASDIYRLDLAAQEAEPALIAESQGKKLAMIGDRDGDVFVLTTRGAENERIVRLSDGADSEWTEVVSADGRIIQNASIQGDWLIVTWMNDVEYGLTVYDPQGEEIAALNIPDFGQVAELSRAGDKVLLLINSYIKPTALYSFDPLTGELELRRETKVAFETDRYEVLRENCSSSDGTRIPVILAKPRNLSPTQDTPLYLSGYGGFGVVLSRNYSQTKAFWMQQGGIYAFAHIRGGGEYGTAWHHDGRLEKKQNVFNDFIAASECLIANGWTSSEKLAIEGGSNGGLLMMATMLQRPDLFGAVVAGASPMDMLRHHLFTIGPFIARELGSSETPEGFKYLSAYSPYQNIDPHADYPPLLVITGDRDDRVPPGPHSYKFIARMQAETDSQDPILLSVVENAGHWVGLSEDQQMLFARNQTAFMMAALGMQIEKETKDGE